jgi:tryptophan-rich sensory protein
MSGTARYWLSAGAAGVAASFFSLRMGSVFTELRLPLFFPPAWLLQIGWTAALVLLASALTAESERKAARAFYISLGLTVCWAVFFFRLNAPAAALVCGLLLTGVWLHLRRLVCEKPGSAGKRLLPCCIWAGYMAYLNAGILLLN